MKYSTVKNLNWNISREAISCTVNFDSIGEVPFAANPNDSVEHGREIYARCIAGDFGPIADYVPYIDEGENPQSTAPIPEIPTTNTGESVTNPNEVL
jgi:hypothetical protein